MRQKVEVTLPKHWKYVRVDQISRIIRGVSYKKEISSDELLENYVPILRATNIQEDNLILDTDLVYIPNKIVKQEQFLMVGDVVVCISSGSKNLVGKSAQLGNCWIGSFGTFCATIRFNSEVNKKFGGFFFTSPLYRESIKDKSSGVNINNIRLGHLGEISIPLPPLQEQEQIVSKIEELFTQLDAAEAALQRAKTNLKRYRQALLQAAVTGDLTKEWREAHKNELEPASKLLERIKAERKAKWEAEIRAKGKDPAKEKYKEPKDPDASDLTELPEGWCWVTLSNLTYQIADVDHKMPKATENGIPYVSTKDFVSNGEIDFENSKKISDKDFQHLSRKIKPEKNDILLSRYGTVGEVRLVKTNIQFQASYSIAILKTIYEPTLINYSIFVLQSKIIQDQIKVFIRGVAQPDLGLTHIREMCIPLPPLDEQKEILSILEHIEAITEKTNSIITENIRRTESLRKSILHHAFTGKLIQSQTEELE